MSVAPCPTYRKCRSYLQKCRSHPGALPTATGFLPAVFSLAGVWPRDVLQGGTDAATEVAQEVESPLSKPSVPNADDTFDQLSTTFVYAAAANPTAYGLAARGRDVDLQDALKVWVPAYASHKDLSLKALAATGTKKDARKSLKKVLQSKMRKVNALPGVTNTQRAALGMSQHAVTATPIAAPTTWPVGRIVDQGARRQAVHWVDQLHADPAEAKPHGIQLCELWLKIGDPKPIDETGCVLIKRCTRTPFVYQFAAADVGKTAYWLLRWVSTKAEFGPWAPAVVVTVPALRGQRRGWDGDRDRPGRAMIGAQRAPQSTGIRITIPPIASPTLKSLLGLSRCSLWQATHASATALSG